MDRYSGRAVEQLRCADSALHANDSSFAFNAALMKPLGNGVGFPLALPIFLFREPRQA